MPPTLPDSGPILSASERGADPQSALDLALDKIDRQVVRHKEKVTHRKQATSPVRVPTPEAAPARSSEPDRLRIKVRPMTLEQAVAELEADTQPFLVFLNEDSGSLHIAVRREDGSLAVIEPVIP